MECKYCRVEMEEIKKKESGIENQSGYFKCPCCGTTFHVKRRLKRKSGHKKTIRVVTALA